jgi:hypothetical protein
MEFLYRYAVYYLLWKRSLTATSHTTFPSCCRDSAEVWGFFWDDAPSGRVFDSRRFGTINALKLKCWEVLERNPKHFFFWFVDQWMQDVTLFRNVAVKQLCSWAPKTHTIWTNHIALFLNGQFRRNLWSRLYFEYYPNTFHLVCILYCGCFNLYCGCFNLFCNVFGCFGNICTCIYCTVFTVSLYCFVYLYLFLFVLSVLL